MEYIQKEKEANCFRKPEKIASTHNNKCQLHSAFLGEGRRKGKKLTRPSNLSLLLDYWKVADFFLLHLLLTLSGFPTHLSKSLNLATSGQTGADECSLTRLIK